MGRLGIVVTLTLSACPVGADEGFRSPAEEAILAAEARPTLRVVSHEHADNDGDGIGDAFDKCQDSPEVFNGLNDDDGCPDDPPKTQFSDRYSPMSATAPEVSIAPSSFESHLIYGLTSFVVGRARQEAIAFALDKIQTYACKRPETATFFQATCGLFLAAEATSTTVVPGSLLREALLTDLYSLPTQLAPVLEGAHKPELAAALRLSYNAVTRLRAGTGPLTVVADVVAPSLGQLGARTDALEALKIVVSVAVRSGPSDLRQFRSRPELLLARVHRAYLLGAFVYLREVIVPPRDPGKRAVAILVELAQGCVTSCSLGEISTSLTSRAAAETDATAKRLFEASAALALLLSRDVASVGEFQTALSSLDKHIGAVSEALQALGSNVPTYMTSYRARVGSLSAEAARLVDAVCLVVDASETLRDETDRDQRVERSRALVGAVFDLVASTLVQNPGDVLVGLKIGRHLAAGEFGAAIVAMSGLPFMRENPGVRAIIQLGTTMVEIAAAKSVDQVAAALEASAAPVGSWRLRRKKDTFGLSGRLGVNLGGEYYDNDDLSSGNLAFVAGVHLPIVLDYHGAGKWPFGFGLQVLDLGAILSIADAQSDEVKEAPRVELSSVFSLGFGMVVGLGDSPFQLGATVAWSPGLRRLGRGVAETGDEEKTVNALRFFLSATIDVPIFMY